MLIGVDIVDIDRIKTTVERTPRFLHRVYTQNELEYCLSKKNPYPSLAVRFAAKEALRKVHPVFATGIRFHDVEVFRNKDGRPELVLYNRAWEKQKQAGIQSLSLSLSHAKHQAIAAVIATERVMG